MLQCDMIQLHVIQTVLSAWYDSDTTKKVLHDMQLQVKLFNTIQPWHKCNSFVQCDPSTNKMVLLDKILTETDL